MGNKITITSVKSKDDNRKLKKDDKGYYLVNAGAYNIFNSAGDYYTAKGVENKLREPGSVFQRRLRSGNLRSEVEHPRWNKGMSKNEFVQRNLKVDFTNTCGHIRDIVLTPTNIASGYGNDKILKVQIWIKPSGPHGDALGKSLENTEENTCFSVRSFTDDKRINGIVIKRLLQVVTWDWVGEPGISLATKWKTLSIESTDQCTIDIDDIVNDDGDLNECVECSLESADEKDMLKDIVSNDNTASYNFLDKW